MRVLLIGVLSLFASGAAAHEWTSTPAANAMHALYHKAKESYVALDSLTFRRPFQEKPEVYSHYFDPATGILYSCFGSGDETACSGPDRPLKKEWGAADILYGKKHNSAPVDSYLYGPEYFLEGANPFSQFSTYTYYAGKEHVIRCRRTYTTYNFEFERNGQHLFFHSEKKDQREEKCEDLYPPK